MNDSMSLSSGDYPPPPPAREATRSAKRSKMIVHEDEEVNQVSLPQNNDDEELHDNDDDDDDDDEVRQDSKPIGNVVRVSGEGESRRNHFLGLEVDGVSYELEDTVLVSPEGLNIYMKPSVSIIKDISETSDGLITVTGRRFYRPEFAEKENGGNWESGEERELFYSFEEIEFAADSVMHKCRVHFVPPNKMIPSSREYPGFIIDKVYDAKLKRLDAILDVGYGDNRQHELFKLVQKTMDRIPNWPLKVRLKENFKSKFKNTANFPLLCDDDDFVNPPPGNFGVENDAQVQNLAVAIANEEGGQQQGNFGLQHDFQLQNLAVAIANEEEAPQEGNKGVLHGDQIQNLGIVMGNEGGTDVQDRDNMPVGVGDERSRSRKGKKRKAVTRLSQNKKKAKQQPKTGNKDRRAKIVRNLKVSVEVKKKVIKIGSSSKKRKPGTKKVKENRVKKEHPPGLRKLKTRMTPIKMCMAINSLSREQMESVNKMGLGTFLGMGIENLPNTLTYYLLDHYDPLSNRIILENQSLEITKRRIHDVLGISMEGKDISELPSCESDNPILKEWKAQFSSTNLSNTYIMKLIKESKKDDVIFRLNFLTLFINTFIESKPMGTSNDRYVDKLVLVEDYTSIDWCEYVVQSLKRKKGSWNRDDVTCYYAGPIAVILLVYLLSVKIPQNVDIKKQRPLIKSVNGHTLEKFERYEIDADILGRGQLDDKIDDVGDKSKNENEGDTERVDKDFADEEAYSAIIEMGIDKIIEEKRTIEQALENGKMKYPESQILQEWSEKFKKLFNMDGRRYDGEEDSKTKSVEETESDANINQSKEGKIGESSTHGGQSPFTPINSKQRLQGREEEDESSRGDYGLEHDVPKGKRGIFVKNAPDPATPTLTLESSVKKRNRLGAKKKVACDPNAEKLVNASSRKRRKSWTSLKEIDENNDNGNGHKFMNITIPLSTE